MTRENITISGGDLSTSWRKFDHVRTAPAGAATANIEFWVSGHTSGSGTIRIDDAFIEPLSSEEVSMRARHTVALNVNGHVSGTVSENDGETSSFGIQADRFSIVPSSNSGERLHWSNGNLRIYDSNNVLRVQLGVW